VERATNTHASNAAEKKIYRSAAVQVRVKCFVAAPPVRVVTYISVSNV
jgi:hypothetical protein